MRILVVEDEPKVAKALSSGLTAECYDVRAASTGEDAFFLMNEESFDLVLLDLMLPRRDGLEILAALRKRGVETPVLILTAKDTVEDRVQGLDSGADDYLLKPFAFPELLARIRALLRRGRTEQALKLRFSRKITADSLDERLPIENAEDEFGRLATVFNETLARLQDSFERLRRFTADASHELRTPLTAMRSVGEVALHDSLDPAAYRDVIGSMLEEVERLTASSRVSSRSRGWTLIDSRSCARSWISARSPRARPSTSGCSPR